MHNVPEDRIFGPSKWTAFGTQNLESADFRVVLCKSAPGFRQNRRIESEDLAEAGVFFEKPIKFRHGELPDKPPIHVRAAHDERGEHPELGVLIKCGIPLSSHGSVGASHTGTHSLDLLARAEGHGIHGFRYGNPQATAAKYGLDLRDLNARAGREGWSS
jgi:hypothetical protein